MAQVPESLLAAVTGASTALPPAGDQVRRAARERFISRGMPTRRDEEWKYTSLKSLETPRFRQRSKAAIVDPSVLAKIVGADDIAVVFVDGILSLEHTQLDKLPAGLSILPLADSQTGQNDVWSRIADRADFDSNPFADLNCALLGQGAMITVETGVQLAPAIHLVHLISTAESLTAPRHMIRVGKGSKAQVLETHVHLALGPALTVCAVDIAVEENAMLYHTRDQHGGDEGIQISVVTVTVGRDALYETFGLAQAGRLIRNDIAVEINGQGAQVKLDGLYLVANHSVIDNHTCIDHKVPRAVSKQLYKGILDGEGRGVFNGKILVRKDAQQTQAFQTNKNLLRSAKAEIDTKPELRIDADDVKCAHGAAIGRLDANEIFYLQSRGIPRHQAEAILASAFAEDVIMRIENETLRRRIHQRAQSYFRDE